MWQGKKSLFHWTAHSSVQWIMFRCCCGPQEKTLSWNTSRPKQWLWSTEAQTLLTNSDLHLNKKGLVCLLQSDIQRCFWTVCVSVCECVCECVYCMNERRATVWTTCLSFFGFLRTKFTSWTCVVYTSLYIWTPEELNWLWLFSRIKVFYVKTHTHHFQPETSSYHCRSLCSVLFKMRKSWPSHLVVMLPSSFL